MSLTLGYLLTTLAAQAGSAYFNCKRTAKQAKDLAKKQQTFEERVLREGIEKSRQEFSEICSLQREIENQIQHDRIQLIRDNHNNSLMLDAYQDSLAHWPLLVPPFIMKNECLPLLETIKKDQTETIVVNCILTPSIDLTFNHNVFLLLEERLAQFFSKYWATSSAKAIRFYQQAWRGQTGVGSDLHELKAHLSVVPTIVLSPIFKDNKLKFSFFWWGLSNREEDKHISEEDKHISEEEANIFDPELSVSFTTPMEYSNDTINTILNECVPKLEAFISYFADLYYWNFYHLTPSLLGSIVEQLSIPNKQCYYDQYQDLLENSLSELYCVHRYPERLIEFAGMLPTSSQREEALLSICSKLYLFNNQKFHSIDDFLNISFSHKDINILNDIKQLFPAYSDRIDKIIEAIPHTMSFRNSLCDEEKYGRVDSKYDIIKDTTLDKSQKASKYHF